MIMDKLTEFADAVALNTGAAGTYNVGSLLDLGAVHRDVGDGQLFLNIEIDTAVDSAGDGVTVAFKLVSDATETISTTTATVHLTTPVFAQATLAAGYRFSTRLPLEGNTYERCLAIQQVTAVEAVTAGAFSAYLTKDVPVHTLYNDAVN